MNKPVPPGFPKQLLSYVFSRKCATILRSCLLNDHRHPLYSDTKGKSGKSSELVTMNWINQIVVGSRLCPWANSVKQRGVLRCKVSSVKTIESLLQDAEIEISLLESSLKTSPDDKTHNFPETTLLVIEQGHSDATKLNHQQGSSAEFLGDFR
jgi:hypothetical protein